MGKATKKRQNDSEAEENKMLQKLTDSNDHSKGRTKKKFNKRKRIQRDSIHSVQTCMRRYGLNAYKQIHAWVPHRYSLDKAQTDLIKYAYVAYAIPHVFRSLIELGVAWPSTTDNDLGYCTAMQVCRGGSFYKLHSTDRVKALCKYVMSRKETHTFLTNGPYKFTNNNAFYIAFQKNMVWSKATCAGLKTGVPEVLANHAFYLPFSSEVFVLFLKRHENNYAPQDIGDILDFLEDSWANLEYPSFAGRSWTRIVHAANHWHADVANVRMVQAQQRRDIWSERTPPVSKEPFKKQNKIEERWLAYRDADKLKYIICRLHNYDALQAEGNRMHHCVGAYYTKCRNGHSEVYSVARQEKIRGGWTYSDIKHAATLEISCPQNSLVQARGVCNKPMVASTKKVIKEWARKNNVDVALYV